MSSEEIGYPPASQEIGRGATEELIDETLDILRAVVTAIENGSDLAPLAAKARELLGYWGPPPTAEDRRYLDYLNSIASGRKR